MVSVYYQLIKNGKLTLDDIKNETIKEKVRKLLEEE